MGFTDESKIVISSLPQILWDKQTWNTIANIMDQYQPELIILGYPGTDREELSSIQKEILDFSKKLSKDYGIEVLLRDESYTSNEAGQIYIQQRGGKKTSLKKIKDRKEKIDSLAAHLLIKAYLNHSDG